MILTHCAVCATELGLSLGKKCGRCSTRYCGAECQVQHWKEGGHDKLCKPIKKAGGAEQYNATKKYAEAVAAAAEKCADDTKGQTCYICTQALHWKTKEGLVRGCSCRGTAGFAHVSCLAEEAKILFAEAEENNLDFKVQNKRIARWYRCSLCEQEYHGVVACALGWACWKTYLGRPEVDVPRRMAMTTLGNGLCEANRHEDALCVRETQLTTLRRIGAQADMLMAMGNLANSYSALGQFEQALRLRREVYSKGLILNGEEHKQTVINVICYAATLIDLRRFEEAKSLLRKSLPMARRVLGESHEHTLRMKWHYGHALHKDEGATLDDLREADGTLAETAQTARRVLGNSHPTARWVERELIMARAALRAREALEPSDVTSIREAMGAMAPGGA